MTVAPETVFLPSPSKSREKAVDWSLCCHDVSPYC